jgi:phage gpG-like protein
VTTIPEINAKLKDMQGKARYAAAAAAVAMGVDFSVEVQVEELRRYTHAVDDVPTNSPPGEPPAYVSGALARSVVPEPAEIGAAISRVIVGGHVVYARIHELGGWAGRDHASYLPPRPYLKPAAERFIGTRAATTSAVRGWLTVMR